MSKMRKVVWTTAILLCAFAVLIVRAKHPNVVRKWRVKLGLQATRSDTWEKIVPAGKVQRHEAPYDFGDVYIEGVPMVNQGQKGYCVPATISRVLRYYGIDVDMHALALDMETDVGGGTSIGNGIMV